MIRIFGRLWNVEYNEKGSFSLSICRFYTLLRLLPLPLTHSLIWVELFAPSIRTSSIALINKTGIHCFQIDTYRHTHGFRKLWKRTVSNRQRQSLIWTERRSIRQAITTSIATQRPTIEIMKQNKKKLIRANTVKKRVKHTK